MNHADRQFTVPAPTMHQPIFGSFGDYPAPPDNWARCTICLGLFTIEQIADVCPGPQR
jgi:hypothetical protein